MMAYYSIERGNSRITKSGRSKFETHSGIRLKADNVASMLIQLATDHPEFLQLTDGLIWYEISEEQADRKIGRDLD